MTNPVVFIDVNTSSYETLGNCLPGVLLSARNGYFDIELQNKAEEQPGKVKVVKNGGGQGVLFVEFDKPVVWVAAHHCVIFKALERLFCDILVLDYMPNQIGAYRYSLLTAAAHKIDSDYFKEPIALGFGSTMEGIETNARVHSERRALKAEQFREELREISAQIETLESVKERLQTVYEADYRGSIAIGYTFGGLHFYVNLVDGECDRAGLLRTDHGDVVGIFLSDNIFVTKQQTMKQAPIDLSMIDPVDFNTMLENYADVAEATGLTPTSRRSSQGRSSRGRSYRDR